MNLFVSAANLPGVHPRDEGTATCQTVFFSVSSGADTGVTAQQDGESTLDHAFLSLWNGLEGSDHQISLCVRVLAFHYLMVRTNGRAVEGWTLDETEPERTITLHPAVIETIAAMPLSTGFLLSMATFRELLDFPDEVGSLSNRMFTM